MKTEPGQLVVGAFSGRVYLMRISSKEESDMRWSLQEETLYTQLIEHYLFFDESHMYEIIDAYCTEYLLPVVRRIDTFTWLLIKDPLLKQA